MEKEIKKEGGRCGTTQRDRQNQRKINLWAFAWALSWLGISFSLKYGWLPTGIPAVAATILPTTLGVMVILAYRGFLRETDELLRKIHLDALAFSAGMALVGGVTYSILVRAEAVADKGFTVMMLLLTVSYMVTVVLGYRRYS